MANGKGLVITEVAQDLHLANMAGSKLQIKRKKRLNMVKAQQRTI